MSRRDRRRQLLEVAASLLVAEGTRAVTMERVAELSGVSKALPYAHFANAEELLVAVYQRSSMRLGRVVWTALSEASERRNNGDEVDLATEWVRSHFRHGAGQGDIFAALITPGSAIPSMADRNSEGEDFVGRVLHRFFDVPVPQAKAVAGLIIGAIVGASNAWLRDDGNRDAIERSLIEMIRGVVASTTCPHQDLHDHALNDHDGDPGAT